MSSNPVAFHYVEYQENVSSHQFSLSVLDCCGDQIASYAIPQAATDTDHTLSLSVVRESSSPDSNIFQVDETASYPPSTWECIPVNLLADTYNRVVFLRDHDREDINLLFLGTEDLRPHCSFKLPCYHIISLYLAEVRLFKKNNQLYVARNPLTPNAEASYSRLLTRLLCSPPAPDSFAAMPQQPSHPTRYRF